MEKIFYELTNPQKSILLTEQFYANTCINNICGTAILKTKLDFKLLEQAIHLLIKNNDGFRLRLDLVGNEVKQYLSEYTPFEVELVELNCKEDISALENALIQKQFALYNSCLFAFKMFRLPDGSGGFSVNVHHLISDSWTLGLLSKEIVNFYLALCKKEDRVTNPDFSYLNYIQEEKDYLASEKCKKDKEYWDHIFTTIPEIATIPSRYDNISNLTSSVAKRCSFSMPSAIMQEIQSLCTKLNITAFNFFMAVYAIYISKISNVNDFVLATPILNRTNFKQKNTAGMFINIAPFRITLPENTIFSDFASSLAKDSMAMLRHQKYPYEAILENLRKKDHSVPNLYNILLSYQITKATEKEEIEYETNWVFNQNTADDIDIHLYDLNSSGHIDISYDYKISKYEKEDIVCLHERILHLIKQILQNPNSNLDNLEFITPSEKDLVVNTYNQTAIDYDSTKAIINFFEEQAFSKPNEPALTFQGKTMDYQELNEKANSLAFALRKANVTNNSIVGIMTNRSFEMMISILAVLKAGGAYIPIDPDYPQDRIEYMLEDSKATLLLTQEALMDKVNCKNKITVDLTSELYTKNKENLTNISKPDDLSYLIYTSGSTGKPKGVMLTQKTLSNFYASMLQTIAYLKDKKPHSIVSITTLSFDIFAFETLISLCSGLHLFVTDYYEQKVTEKLEELIKKNKIEIIQTTPSVMRFHLDNLTNPKDLASLRYVVLAGEQLPKALVERIKDIIPNVSIYNGYGPSETTIFSSVCDVTNLDTIHIGRPIGNTQFYILDSHKNVLPPYCVGEIYIAGDGVGKGYLYQPELTKASFLPNPFHNNSLLYKTGDLGRWIDGGFVECKGRIDHQVKLRGLRVELGEIENKINTFGKDNSLKSAVIIKHENGKEALCAFIETVENENASNTSTSIDIASLKKYLLSVLPNYMVPTYFVPINKLPQTPNGKIDRKALAAHPVSLKNHKTDMVVPQTPTEKKLFALVSSILSHSNFGMNEDLFALGMDSLNIIRLSSKIMKMFDISISIKQLYSVTSLLELANLIDDGNKKETETFSLCTAPANDSYPLSEEQLSIFYAVTMSNPDCLFYNVSGGILFEERLAIEKVQSCFTKIIKQHASFRTIFKFMDQEPRQIILDEVPFAIETFSGDATKTEEIISGFSKPFALDTAPLLRVALCYLDNGTTLLLLDSHHLIMDGSSLQILVKDFEALYHGNPLLPTKWNYIDFAYSEKLFLNSPASAINRNYWVNRWKEKEIPTIALPYDYSPHVTSNAGDSLQLSISEETFATIDSIAKQNGLSQHMVFLATFYLLLYHYTSQNHILVGMPIANRFLDAFEDIIGMFVNNAVLDITMDSDKTFAEFFDDIKLALSEAIQYQPYPYHSLVKDLNLSGKNLFDVMFVYQNEYTTKIDFKYANNHTAKFNLSCEVLPDKRCIYLEYRTDLFKTSTMKRFLEHYHYLLEHVSELLSCKIADCDILPSEEKNKILYDFNNTSLSYANTNLVKLFEENAKNFPDNIAVIFEEKSLNYRELNEKANILAHHLQAMSVSADSVISILLPRSFDLIIAIYAVLKCGASYVLIDTTFPEDRIHYIMEDSHSKLCITNHTLSKQSNIDCLEMDALNFLNENTTNLSTPCSDHLCMIYTSGSTGKPKGVVLHNHGFTNLLYAFDKEMNISAYSKILGIATVSFDMFAVELFSSLSFGNTLVLANEEEQKNVIAMSQLIKKYQVEFLVTTPSRIELLLLDECENPLKNIKAFQLGGEKFTFALYEKLRRVTDAKIFNGYGPTEITACCSNKLVTSSAITIGKPIGNVQIYICNSNMHLCPIGVVGEICVAGLGVANGYLNKPDITRKNFVPNPFGSGMLYKTGDLGKYHDNGEIEYVGRSDFQVKIRGLRIELSEIENQLNQLSSVEQSAVLYKNNVKSPYLIAFVVSKTDINVHDIKTELAKSLPVYMIPRYLIQLEQLPITTNGKVDRKALENYKVSTQTNNISEDYTPPKTQKQKLFCDIWSSLLNLEVGIDDDLFDIGADSLLAIRFKIELLSHQIDLPYADIFQYRTIRELCNNHTETDLKKDSLNDFNYLPIQELLKNQSYEFNTCLEHNVLLLGSTGFIGMHIIDSFLKHSTGKIYCIVREKNKTSVLSRFMDLLHFYFGNTLDSFIDSRIFIVKGDILKENFGLSNQMYQTITNDIQVVINAAANVKHYGSKEKFVTININALQNAIDFCLANQKRLIHLSSLSISGNMILDGHLSNRNGFSKKFFTEEDLFVGQTLDNVYSRSKFEAERIILDTIFHKKLNAQILRLGNITNRYRDGVFQINPEDNAFANRLKTFLQLHIFPDYLLKDYVEFTPVDLCADAIIQVLNNNCPNMYIAHIYNQNHVYFSKLLKYLTNLNYDIQVMTEDKFQQKLTEVIHNKNSSNYLSGIVNDFNTEQKLDYSSYIQITNTKTNEFLHNCNFDWPDIDFDYIKKYVSYLKEINFID